MRTQAQYTIYSLNDVVTSATAPSSPYKGQLWVDTSQTPPITMVYNGSSWVEANGTATLRSNISTLTTKQSSFQTSLNGLTSSVSLVTTRVKTLEDDVGVVEEDIVDIKEDVSELEQTASSIALRVSSTEANISSLQLTTSSISATVSNKVDQTYGTSSSSFGWSLKSSGFYVYSGASTVMSITSSGLSIVGAIDATSGSIGSLTIDGYLRFGGDSTYYISANYNDGNYYIYLPGFRVDKASTAVFSGKLSAPSGTIGGFTITTSAIYKTKTAYSNSTSGVYIGTDGIGLGAGTFYVNSSGSLHSVSGNIGGFTISSSSIYKTKTAYNNTTSGVYVGTDGIGLGAGTFYVTAAGELYAVSGKIGGMSLNASQMFSQNFILGTVYDSSDITKSFTTLSFGETSGSTFTATTVITNTGSYFNLLSSNYISCGYITCTAIKSDPSISSSTGFYFGYSGGTATYYAELSWSGAMLYLKIYNSEGVQTPLTSSKSFTIHYACIWGGDTTWNATVSAGSSSTSHNTSAFWGIDYATFNYSSSNKSQHTYYFSVSGSSASTTITSYGHIVPYFDNTYNLGSAAYKWSNIYGQAGIVNTSDRKEKKEIQNMSEIYSRIFDKLIPVTFKFIENTSDRTHTGLIAQDVKDAIESVGLTTKEFGGYCEWENDDGEYGCGLRYSEFVSMNIYEIQKLKARVTELEEKIKSLEDDQNEIE